MKVTVKDYKEQGNTMYTTEGQTC